MKTNTTFKLNVVVPAVADWIPAAGTFANISTNTLYDVRPSGWPTSDIAGPFANWAGGVYAQDFSSLGAYVMHGSGHLTPNTSPFWSGVWCFDLDTRAWVGRNIPAAPLYDARDYNTYGECTESPVVGHLTTPHTYDGLSYQSTANGGSSQGSMLTCFFPGTAFQRCAHVYDLSSLTAPPARVVDSIATGGGSSNYPMSATDEARGGVWLLAYDGIGPLQFIKFSDWSVTQHAGIEYGTYANNSLVYVPAPWDCLIGMGNAGSGGVEFGIYVCPIVANVPQGFTRVYPSGTPPSDGRCGGQWSTLLQKVVSYQAGGSYTVHKLTLPAPGSLVAGAWGWSSETLTGASGATPSNCPAATNGAWGRFIEVPTVQSFIWCDGVTQPTQAWRLTGM